MLKLTDSELLHISFEYWPEYESMSLNTLAILVTSDRMAVRRLHTVA